MSWVLLSASMLWGLTLSTKTRSNESTRRLGPRSNWMLDLHRYLGGASVAFVAIHVIAILLDSYVHFGLVDVLVPLATSWHPVAVAWGIVGFYLLVAVELTSLLRRRISKRAWRLTHFLSFPLFATATTHMLSAGTDGTAPTLRVAAMVVVAAVTGMTIVRVVQTRTSRPPASRVPARLEPPPRVDPTPPAPRRPSSPPVTLAAMSGLTSSAERNQP